jgi:Divergent InlB B-repeat domain
VAPRAWVRVHAAARLAAAAIVAVVGLQAAVAPAAALSICATENCATLSVTFTGDGGGTVTSDDGNITCTYRAPTTSGTCGERVIWTIGGPNPTVTLTARPVAGSSACFGPVVLTCNPEGLAISEPFTLLPGDVRGAQFQLNNSTRTLTASVSGNGQGTILAYSAQIICPAVCTSVLPYGWVGTFTATPSAGSVFKKWTGACAGQGATCQLTLTADTTIDAVFDVAVAATPTAAATARSKPAATPRPTTAGVSPPPGNSAVPTDTGAASPSPSQQVLGATATPAASAAPPADPANGSGSDSIPWLPIIALVVVVAIALNALAFQVLRARRPPP